MVQIVKRWAEETICKNYTWSWPGVSVTEESSVSEDSGLKQTKELHEYANNILKNIISTKTVKLNCDRLKHNTKNKTAKYHKIYIQHTIGYSPNNFFKSN